METRQHKLGLVTGAKGAGKSYTTFGTILDIYRGDISKGIYPRKVLIMDVNDEYGQYNYKGITYRVPAIDIADVGWFSEHLVPHVRRISPFTKNGKMSLTEIQEALYHVIQNFGNGVLLVEDINKYIGAAFSQELIGIICSHRHANLDIVMHYQSLGKINPTLWQNFNWLRMHRDTDNIKRIYEKTAGFNDLLQIAQDVVNTKYREGNTQFSLYYNNDKRIISGNFTKKEAENAILSVMSNNRSEIYTPVANKIDRNGRKIFTAQQAVDEIISQYMINNIRCVDSAEV